MLSESGEGSVIVIVTFPAFADSVFLSNLSCDWSALSASCWPPPPPPPPDAAPVEGVDAELLLDDLSFEPPQPASASSAAAPRMLSRFMRRRLPRCGNE